MLFNVFNKPTRNEVVLGYYPCYIIPRLHSGIITVLGMDKSSEDTCSYFQVLLSRNKELA